MNRLSFELSPYLKQHENNPVHWYAWNSEALKAAQTQNKPIFLSVGYSTCHWCHVMAHESFEDTKIAEILNQTFICIKVDREERPDIDEIYMQALLSFQGSGGWPLNVFLTPDLLPFYGGTYFPPAPRNGIPSFEQLIIAIKETFEKGRGQIDARGKMFVEALNQHAQQFNLHQAQDKIGKENLIPVDFIDKYTKKSEAFYAQLMSIADKSAGGFGTAPKFPEAVKLRALVMSPINSHFAHGLLSLNRIMCGGISDQVEGGISRYSVDGEWNIPHFEKMLYDNAQLLPLFAMAAARMSRSTSGIADHFKKMSERIFDYLNSKLKCRKSGLFYCGEDADSGGEEGQYYSFTEAEFKNALEPLGNENVRTLVHLCGVSKAGNFDGANVLSWQSDLESFCKRVAKTEKEIIELWSKAKPFLFALRQSRDKPSVDTKCLLGWNAILVKSLLEASVALEKPEWGKAGIDLLDKCLISFLSADKQYYCHNFKDDKAYGPSFADDAGFLLDALIAALIMTGHKKYLTDILFVVRMIHSKFVNPQSGMLYMSSANELPVRAFKPEDGVMSSAQNIISTAVQKLLTFINATQIVDLISNSELKMLQALQIICLANVDSLIANTPLACAQIFSELETMSTSRILLLQNKLDDEGVSFQQLANVSKEVWSMGKTQFYLGNKVTDEFDAERFFNISDFKNIDKSKMFFCSHLGCALPTFDIQDILKQF